MSQKEAVLYLGSPNDWEKANPMLELFNEAKLNYRVGFASCHRNIDGDFEQETFLYDEPIIVMLGGMEFAAPGIMSSLLRNRALELNEACNFNRMVFAVPTDQAARSAIENLPMGTVVLTTGFNEVSARHSIINAALATIQFAAMLRSAKGNGTQLFSSLKEIYKTDPRFSKPLVHDVELVDGLLAPPK